jgi:hypothetical protein
MPLLLILIAVEFLEETFIFESHEVSSYTKPLQEETEGAAIETGSVIAIRSPCRPQGFCSRY